MREAPHVLPPPLCLHLASVYLLPLSTCCYLCEAHGWRVALYQAFLFHPPESPTSIVSNLHSLQPASLLYQISSVLHLLSSLLNRLSCMVVYRRDRLVVKDSTVSLWCLCRVFVVSLSCLCRLVLLRHTGLL